MNFILGNWEEKIDSNDFINLNRNPYKGESFDYKISVSNKKIKKIELFKVEKPLRKEAILNYRNQIETEEQKKIEMNLIFEKNKLDEIIDFVYPDFSSIAIYGVKNLIKKRKEYLNRMDKQFQNIEWYGRKLKLTTEINELEKFELFCKKQNIKASKACENAKDVLEVIYAAVVYAYCEGNELNGILYNVIDVLDIFIQNELETKESVVEDICGYIESFLENLNEVVVHADLLEEDFGISFTLNSNNLNPTALIFLKIINEKRHKMNFQVILGEKDVPVEFEEQLRRSLENGSKISISQSFRKKEIDNLDLTKYQNFFEKGMDNVFTLGSMNLEEVLLLSVNNGKNYRNGSLINKVSKSPEIEDGFEVVFDKFELYLRYFINIYVEKINLNLFILDNNNSNSFETALLDTFPNFLVNVMFHRINPLITILTAIKDDDFVVKRNEMNLIRKISPKGNKKDGEIAEKINEIIHSELKKMNLYKKAKYSVGYFAETAFYKEKDRFDMTELPPAVFEKSSLSGYIEIKGENLNEILTEFRSSGYSHVRIVDNNSKK